MSHYRDLREFLVELEGRGKLYRFRKRINKDTELLPFYRVQMRGLPDQERKVFLFEDVVNAAGEKYDMPVLAGVYGASEDILTLGIGCESYKEALEKWHAALTRPVPPVLVDKGPVQDEVHMGEALNEMGLDEFPVPVEEPGFSGMLRTGLPMITKDPNNGIRNVGTYNAFFRSRTRMAGGGRASGHLRAQHLKAAANRNEGLPVAIVIGCNPEVVLVGSSEIPYGQDELAIAGGIVGSPTELVRCRTIPLEVPAHAEAVIEGIMSTEVLEPKAAYGEYPGYMSLSRDLYPVIQVTAITHRRDAMFTPMLVGFSPNEANLIAAYSRSAPLYHKLKYESNFPIDEIYFPQLCGARDLCLIRLAKWMHGETVQGLLQEASKISSAKYIIAVDDDINVRDSDLLWWALSFRVRPKEDLAILEGGFGGLDPSFTPIEIRPDAFWAGEGKKKYSRLLINACRKWPYPPVALPKREYMERALQMWKQEGNLPVPRMQEPWYGYTLGHWTDDFQEDADSILQGKYLEAGEKYRKLQEKAEKK